MGKLLGSLEKSFYNIRSFLMGSSQEGSSRPEKINDHNNLSSTVPIKSDEHHISLAEKDDDGDVIGAIFRFDSD